VPKMGGAHEPRVRGRAAHAVAAERVASRTVAVPALEKRGHAKSVRNARSGDEVATEQRMSHRAEAALHPVPTCACPEEEAPMAASR